MLTLHGLIGDHMVLQRDVPLPLRGLASPGTSVVAQLSDVESHAVADPTGQWRLTLAPLPPGGPHELTITAGAESRKFVDIYLGDVWLCSGQSNMAFTVKMAADAEREIASADHPHLRMATISPRVELRPQADVSAAWQVCSPQTVGNFSAVAYFFGRKIIQDLDVPVGLIVAANGHTPAEAWMSREALESDAAFEPLMAEFDQLIAESPGSLDDLGPWRQKWKELSRAAGGPFNEWYPRALEARAAGKPLPPMPPPARGIANAQNPTVLYNSMIAPIVGFPLRGTIWYQGETNAIFGTSVLYAKLFPALIRSWRQAWGQGDFPFLFVQLANHDDVQCDPADELWPQTRQSQLASLSVPNTAMVVTIDIGESRAIHPANKQDVGLRLALAAESNVYGRSDVIWSGPLYRSMRVAGPRIRIRFDHTDGGLDLRGDGGFELTGNGRNWHTAIPSIEANELVLSAAAVPAPRSARYAWKADPKATLFNGAGLPASPFSTIGHST